MQLSKLAILMAAGLSQVQAAALSGRNTTVSSLLHTKVLGPGETLQFWGIPSPEDATRNWDAGWGQPGPVEAPQPTGIQRRCGGNIVHCDGSNVARSDICEALVSTLRNNPRTGVAPNVRALIRTQGSFQCLVAWHDFVGNMVFGYLTDAAAKTLGTCGAGGTVSGWASEVSLNNVCTNQCMSNRADC